MEASMTTLFSRLAIVTVAVAALAVGVRAPAGDKSNVTLTATASAIDKEGNQEITIKMDIDKDWYAYANPVKNDLLEPNHTEVKISGEKKLEKVSVIYPPGKTKATGDIKYETYQGSVEIKATVKRAAGDTGPLDISVNYNVCHGPTGMCLPQETVSGKCSPAKTVTLAKAK
jgi:DsbC/DsbD-like thiol-disulfide interchange protein